MVHKIFFFESNKMLLERVCKNNYDKEKIILAELEKILFKSENMKFLNTKSFIRDSIYFKTFGRDFPETPKKPRK